MTHKERVRAALHGDPSPSSGLDRVPVALWRHFPNDDLVPAKHAARIVEFQNKFDFDFVKVTPASSYPAEMYGATFVDGKNREGTRTYLARPVNALKDWENITPLDATNPVFVRELATLKLVRQQLGADVHILQTIFSPLNSARNLADTRVLDDLRAHPAVLHRALRALTETTARLAIESLRAGADAIFFATQMATRQYLSEQEFREFGEQYDLQLLEAIRAAKPDFVLLHAHGTDIYFERCARYPVEAINWHDRRTAPSLSEAMALRASFAEQSPSSKSDTEIPFDFAQGMASDKLHPRNDMIALVGGINEWETLAAKSREEVIAQARDAVQQTGGRGFILAAGCVIPVDTPEGNVTALVEMARSEQ